jgi:hypothetical protein
VLKRDAPVGRTATDPVLLRVERVYCLLHVPGETRAC